MLVALFFLFVFGVLAVGTGLVVLSVRHHIKVDREAREKLQKPKPI